MSDTLGSNAPLDAPVVEPAEEVRDNSGSVVPVERFNGLMSSFHKEQARAELLAEQLAATQREIEALKNQAAVVPPTTKEPDMADEATTAAVQALLEKLEAQERRQQEAAKAEVLREYPEVAPFADLLIADTPEELAGLAAEFSARLKGLTPEAPAATQEPSPDPIVTSGAVDYQGVDLSEAKKAAREKGDMTEYLRLLAREQGLAED